jgi:transposase
MIRESRDEAVALVRRLLQLRGIGDNAAWLYVMELFAWRGFRNRRQVGASTGLVGTPYKSGDVDHEQGISKAGNKASARWPFKLPGAGSSINDGAPLRDGTTDGSRTGGHALGKSGLSRSPAGWSLISGAI